MREALRGGPPVVVTGTQTTRRTVVRSRSGSNEPPDEVTPRVVTQLVELEGTWRRRHAPADQVYEALRDVAMPEGRPAELFVYPQSLENGSLSHPRSLGAMLADWAVPPGKVDDLRRKIEARKGQPMAEFPATILSAQLAHGRRRGRPRQRGTQGHRRTAQARHLRPTTELACHVALPALDRPETQAVALTVLDACVKSHEGTDPSESLKSMLLIMARRQLKRRCRGGTQAARGVPRGERAQQRRRYDGDYPLYLRKQVLRTIAAEYAHAGLLPDLLKSLGDFLDAPAAPRYGGIESDGRPARHPRRPARQPAGQGPICDPQGVDDADAEAAVVRILSAVGSDDAPAAVFLKTTAATGAEGTRGDCSAPQRP